MECPLVHQGPAAFGIAKLSLGDSHPVRSPTEGDVHVDERRAQFQGKLQRIFAIVGDRLHHVAKTGQLLVGNAVIGVPGPTGSKRHARNGAP